MTAWIVRFPEAESSLEPGLVRSVEPGPVRVAVKDAIDLAGTPTTAGCVAVRDRAEPATVDAECLAGIRAASSDVSIVGKTTLTELCLSPTGVNKPFGTPVNPLAPEYVPGGSSSGSAVALALGEADIALGTDTAGSVRIPAACCGVVGLKTTEGRISTKGVWPLSPTLDSVGPMAADVAGVIAGMRLLEPGFAPRSEPARVVGRVRVDGVDPALEAVVDAALAPFTVREVPLDNWTSTMDALGAIVVAEFWQQHGSLLDEPGVSDWVKRSLVLGRDLDAPRLAWAYAERERWQVQLADVLTNVDILALPTLIAPPPGLTSVRGFPITRLTAPVSLAGLPALSMPIPGGDGPIPVSLQLVGPMRGEELLCATALTIDHDSAVAKTV